ncbi:MAG: tRNA lysidine(34) synthetase TilS [Bacteroidales bacterium]|nr:tRNA lysidine(34) synthetase TilS [Bacteroidales bacterium]
MLDDFLKYIEENDLIAENDRILLAVSGGIDSMVMSHLFIKAGFRTGIAHCNFCLRGAESELDEELVRRFAADNGIVFYSARFETAAYAEEKGISVQMAARELRYKWFEETREKNGFSSIAVAHNLNDNIETLLINLIRGTGITGLTGMRPSADTIIRPLLFATRQSIENYCEGNNIRFREDKSNTETKYIRNKIRHLVIPVIKEINPSVEVTLNETAERLSGAHEIISSFISGIRSKVSVTKKDSTVFNILLLRPYLGNRTIIYELFKPFGITGSQLNDLYHLISGRTGAQLFSVSHRILKNRGELIVSEPGDERTGPVTFNDLQDLRRHPAISRVSIVSIPEWSDIPKKKDTACIDLEKISFPLVIRKWHPGDYFYPFGMKGRKKVSDYFTDRKFSLIDKENTLLLESDGNIVWILGERLDNRFRITSSTKKALMISVER